MNKLTNSAHKTEGVSRTRTMRFYPFVSSSRSLPVKMMENEPTDMDCFGMVVYVPRRSLAHCIIACNNICNLGCTYSAFVSQDICWHNDIMVQIYVFAPFRGVAFLYKVWFDFHPIIPVSNNVVRLR